MIQYIMLAIAKLNQFRKNYPGYTILIVGTPIALYATYILVKLLQVWGWL